MCLLVLGWGAWLQCAMCTQKMLKETFVWDPQHTWHLGPGRNLAAKTLVEYAKAKYPGEGQVSRLGLCYKGFQNHCTRVHEYPSITSFRRGLSHLSGCIFAKMWARCSFTVEVLHSGFHAPLKMLQERKQCSDFSISTH